jgi:hypothetical protein
VSDREAILRVARAVRHAVATRHADSEQALNSYDEELHDRIDQAIEFLRVIQRVDEEYEQEVTETLGEYRNAFEREWGSREA